MKYVCENNRPCCDKYYDFSTEGIFLWSLETCVGDELFHCFLEARGLHEEFLSSFCKERTNIYRYCDSKSAPFLSEDTFIACFFGWIANWDIDYCDIFSKDPFCGHNPEILACDGVHVGVAVRFLSKSTPITKSEIPEVKPVGNRRYNRTLLPGTDDATKKKRTYIRNYCKYDILKMEKTTENATRNESFDTDSECSDGKEVVSGPISNSKSELLKTLTDGRFKTFLSRVLLKQYENQLLKKCARLLLALTSGAALVSFFPWSDLKTLESVFQSLQNDKNNRQKHMEALESFRVQFSDIIECAHKFNHTDEVTDFFLYLIEEVRGMHADDVLSQDSKDINADVLAPFNPTTGISYYFTEKGGQIRHTPVYAMDGNKKIINYNSMLLIKLIVFLGEAVSTNHDDIPEKDDLCTKQYPKVPAAGWTYCFLFFCPLHGHCYGFHLIKGSEGRKDPFYAMYKYMRQAPKVLFYDFACQLNEYSLNREPGFFVKTDMFHDVFHGVNHKCAFAFQCANIEKKRCFNTACAEQFNRYINKIKATGRCLKLTRFVMYMQYMIYLYNVDKTAACTKRKKMMRNRILPKQ